MIQRAIAALAIAALAACAHSSSRSGDTIVIDQQREPISMNPARENGFSSGEFGALLFSYLIKLDDRGRLIPDVATAIPTQANGGISADGRTITYHLRRGVHFSDGASLTSRDCVFSIREVLDRSHSVQSRYGYDRIVSADAPDDETLVLHLREPFAPILGLVIGPQGYPILPQHVLEREPDFDHGAFNDAPVGSGPYVLRKWQRGDRIELDANRYYTPAPRIAHIVIRFVPDANTAMNQLRTGEADAFINDENMGDYVLLQSIPGIVAIHPRVDGVGSLIFNTSAAVTSDATVRHAIAMAIDVPSLVRKSFRGAIDTSQAGRGIFAWAYSQRDFPDVPYDPQRSRALLTQAGWLVGADGIRQKNGMPLQLHLVMQAHTGGDEQVGAAIREYERAVGVDVLLKAFTITQLAAPADLGGPVYGGKFDMALYPFTNGDDPDVTDQFSCTTIPPRGYNKSRFCDPALDAMLASARKSYDPAVRRAHYAAIQRVLSAQLPMVLLYQRRQVDGIAQRLRGVTVSPSQMGPFWDVARWSASATAP